MHRVTANEGDGGLGIVVDILVNCGGIQRRHACEDFPDEDWNEVSINFNIVDRDLLNDLSSGSPSEFKCGLDAF